MERSFAMRRKEITDETMTLDQLFDRFPFIQEIDTVTYLLHKIQCTYLSFYALVKVMMEMEFIVKEKMQSLARERWASKVPAILKQAKVEAIHRARLATVIQESQDGNGKICNKDMFNLDIKIYATRRYYDTSI